MEINLNKLTIDNDGSRLDLENNNVSLQGATFGKVEVFFKDIEMHIIEKIKQYSNGYIFGCIAWFTSENIIDALSKCDNVQIIIQKEDFLRPDFSDLKSNILRSKKYRALYARLKFKTDKYSCSYPINELSVCGDPSVDPVRCVGHFNSDKNRTMPRAHNKFMVFCEATTNGKEAYRPVAVCTGSYNYTINAGNSFENIMYLEDVNGKNEIINAYLKEHHQIFALSESLDWTHNYSEPEFRIGT
ncbi:MAG: hypothetical protein JST49_01805 [Bacteroidetes bacterium]|nr:hypothetical protein [Bacteroidota bacterium]